MARSKNTKPIAPRVAVDVGSTGTRPASTAAVAVLVLSILAALWAVAMMTAPGRRGYYYFFAYADWFMGVISLVSLSVTIMIGLVATDRLVLSIRQRVLLQSAHRTTGVIAVGALFMHVWTKFTKDFIGVIDIFVPFLVEGNALYVGLGTISGWVMVLVMWSGIARAKFIGRGKPWMWRGIHAISYLMWPIALTHGLSAGRPAATWVTVSYVVCVLGVLVGLAVRLSVSLNRRKDFASPAGAGAAKPQETGKLLPTAAAPIRRSPRRAEPGTDLLAPAAGPSVPAWNQPAPPAGPAVPAWNEPAARPVSPAWNEPAARPVSPAWAEPATRPVSASPATRPVSASPAPDDEDYPPRRRPELEAPAPRQRRSVEDDERYDTQTRMSRRDLEDERYRYDEEPAPRSRGTRSQEIYEEPRGRGRRFDDDEEPAPRARRAADDVETTGARMRRDEFEPTGTRMRRDEIESTGARMRRDEIESTSTRMRRDDPESTGARMRRDEVESTSTRMRRYEEEEPAPRSRRREPEFDERPRGRRHAEDEYEEAPRPRAARYEEEPAPRPARSPRYEEEPPRRPSRSEFVDFAEGPAYPADDTPTLVDTSPRRARRGESGRGGRRGPDDGDDGYFSQLRGDVREAN